MVTKIFSTSQRFSVQSCRTYRRIRDSLFFFFFKRCSVVRKEEASTREIVRCAKKKKWILKNLTLARTVCAKAPGRTAAEIRRIPSVTLLLLIARAKNPYPLPTTAVHVRPPETGTDARTQLTRHKRQNYNGDDDDELPPTTPTRAY